MRHPTPLPAHLRSRAFSRREALDAGITSRQLQHDRFVQVHPSVYRLHDLELDPLASIRAAQLALPNDAKVSHQTRLRMLGLEIGDQSSLHFTVARDHHLDLDGITLHRTVRMPAVDDVGVSIAGAFVGIASTLRPLDVVAAGDWLRRRTLLDPAIVVALAHRDPWRPGSRTAVDLLAHLDGRSESVPESHVRRILEAAGLPRPEVNMNVEQDGLFLGRGDLVYRLWRTVIEYEGRHHATDARQFAHDIDRYAGFRRGGWEYVQVTADLLARPRQMCQQVHDVLVARGYDGPPPQFGDEFHRLFASPPPLGHRRAVSEQPHSA